jgi:hypothetical protein
MTLKTDMQRLAETVEQIKSEIVPQIEKFGGNAGQVLRAHWDKDLARATSLADSCAHDHRPGELNAELVRYWIVGMRQEFARRAIETDGAAFREWKSANPA